MIRSAAALRVADDAAASIVQPYFDAVRDVFAGYRLEDGETLSAMKRVRFEIDPSIHDSPRHFAATRDDGLFMMFAPGLVDLDLETMGAIIAHEFGHAADFLYPGRWVGPTKGPGGTARWIDGSVRDKHAAPWRRIWKERSADQIEWAADAIAETVTGKPIRYCGELVLQCFTGRARPRGLR